MENAPTNFSKGAINLMTHFNSRNIPWVLKDGNILTIDLNCVEDFNIQYVNDLQPYTREELIDIRVKFERLANVKGISDTWGRAYLSAADAIDKIDAMIARTEIPENDIKFNEDEKI